MEKNLKEIKKNLKPGQLPPKLEVIFKTDSLLLGLKGLPSYINVFINLFLFRNLLATKLNQKNVCGNWIMMK